LAEERRLFNEAMASHEFRALAHLFFAERECGHVPGVEPGTPVLPLNAVAVVGGGTMGRGIAIALLDAGFPVTLIEQSADAAARAGDAVAAHYAALVGRGRINADVAAQRRVRLSPTTAWTALATADLVIEAVFEEMSLKEEVFRRLARETRPATILASNTSTLNLDRIAEATDDPERVVGLHFFSPANVMRLLEIVRGAKTSAPVLATALALARRLGKIGVVAGVCDGFIGNRMILPYLRQAVFLLEEGAEPAQVDAALEAFGMAMGPFAMSDLAGNDVGWRLRLAQKPWLDASRRYSFLPDRLCEAGRYGQKTGAGWYDYPAGSRNGVASSVVAELIAASRRAAGIVPRRISAEEIVERCLLPLVNEGHRLLDEGIAIRPSDIDVVYAHGYGFPRYRGGPMFWADAQGPNWLVSRLNHYEALLGPDWIPAKRIGLR
jgi:3-hydroxyacyl-CoA dehydrogenase